MTHLDGSERLRWGLWLSIAVVALSFLCVLALLGVLAAPMFYAWKALPRVEAQLWQIAPVRLYTALVLAVTYATLFGGIGILIAWLHIIRRLPTYRRTRRL